MVLAQCCDVCGTKFLREISKFCASCGEKRMEQEVVLEEEELEVDGEENMRGPPAQTALREKCVNTLSYSQVFAPLVCRNKNKKYGKKALLVANMGIQHRIVLDNYEQAKKWVLNAQEVGRLPEGAFNLEEEGIKENLRQIIKENCSTLQGIKLGRKNHKWDEREIYKYLKHHLRYLRRKKRKIQQLTRNEASQEEDLNEIENCSPVEEERALFLMDPSEETSEAEVPDVQPPRSLEDDEMFLLVVLSLPTVDVMKKHLKKVMEELNARVTPKLFGVGFRKWEKEKQLREVAAYYRK